MNGSWQGNANAIATRGKCALKTVVISSTDGAAQRVILYDGIDDIGQVRLGFTVPANGQTSINFEGLPFGSGIFIVVPSTSVEVTLEYTNMEGNP